MSAFMFCILGKAVGSAMESLKKREAKRKMEVLCNKWSDKSSEDLIKDSFVKITASLASLEYMLLINTALLFCRSTGK